MPADNSVECSPGVPEVEHRTVPIPVGPRVRLHWSRQIPTKDVGLRRPRAHVPDHDRGEDDRQDEHHGNANQSRITMDNRRRLAGLRLSGSLDHGKDILRILGARAARGVGSVTDPASMGWCQGVPPALRTANLPHGADAVRPFRPYRRPPAGRAQWRPVGTTTGLRVHGSRGLGVRIATVQIRVNGRSWNPTPTAAG